MATALKEQRRNLPDAPGVYLFRDRKGKVLYVGKAKSIRKRVSGHYSNRVTRGEVEMVELAESIDFIEVGSESEALLAEQAFIKQYKPRFNIRLRDDKSYPFIAISMDEEFPRVYFTRERHRRDRLYFGPYSNAKRVRSTLDTLGKIFMYRSCNGVVPGRRSGSPCLDFYIRRCGAPCVGYVSHAEYRVAIDGVIAFLQGRYAEVERDLETRMRDAAAVHEFEQAAIERNRLTAVRALLEKQRVANSAVGTLDAVGVAVSGTDANAQVFQVRDGVLADRQSFYLANEGELGEAEVLEEFLLQFYASSPSVPPQVIVASELTPAVGEALSEKRGARVEVRRAERGDKRRILELATRNAKLALDTERLKVERSRQQRTEALDALQRALALESLPLRIECFDISNLMGTHTTASMVVFEGGAPKKSDYRRFVVRGAAAESDYSDDFAAMEEVLTRRLEQWERQQDRSPHDPKRNESFATLPNVIVIDGGPGQLSAGVRALQGFLDRGVAVISLAKRIEEVFVPGRRDPIVLAHDTPELQLLQRVRDEAHRFAIAHHRIRRDKAMTTSILDGLPGIGPTRKRALLKHFGSPDAILAATASELEAVPGLPPKTARELHAHLHRVGE